MENIGRETRATQIGRGGRAPINGEHTQSMQLSIQSQIIIIITRIVCLFMNYIFLFTLIVQRKKHSTNVFAHFLSFISSHSAQHNFHPIIPDFYYCSVSFFPYFVVGGVALNFHFLFPFVCDPVFAVAIRHCIFLVVFANNLFDLLISSQLKHESICFAPDPVMSSISFQNGSVSYAWPIFFRIFFLLLRVCFHSVFSFLFSRIGTRDGNK